MMQKVCERCDREMKLIPAGISKKTKKPYSSFWSCDSRNGGCGNTARSEGEGGEQQPYSYGGSHEPAPPMIDYDFGPPPAPTASNNGDRLDRLEKKIDEVLALLKNNLG